MDKIKVWVRRRKTRKTRKHKGKIVPVFTYGVQWSDPQTGRTKTESCGTDSAYAKQRAAEIHKELIEGRYRDIIPISYDDFVKEHLSHITGKGNHNEHDLALRQFKTACKPKNLTVINYAMLERFKASRVAAGVTPATINKGLRILRAALEKAVKRSYLKVNPFVGHRQALWVDEPEPDVNIMEPGEFEKLLAACQDDTWRAICLIAYYGGLRRGEIINLEWTDIDFAEGVIRVRNHTDRQHTTKSKKIRQVPMDSRVKAALQALQVNRLKSNFVIMNTAGRQKLHNFNSCFNRILIRAGLVDDNGKPGFSVHALRRSCATELLRRGVNPKTVQRILGHSKLDTTMRYYAGVTDKDLQNAIKSREATA